MGEQINCDVRGNVANADLMARLYRFATLATRLDFLSVARNPLECHPCHNCHANKGDRSDSVIESRTSVTKMICFQWLKTVMDEGHLEPSQPDAGKAVGWPVRHIPIESLWIDFCCWFSKLHFANEEMPDEGLFYNLLDHLFIRHGDKYEFPSLEQCRETFELLRVKHECD